MDINTAYKIGYILRPHGLKGEVTVSLDAEAPENLNEVDTIFIELNRQLVPHFVESISIKGDKAYVKFEDATTPEAAKAISKSALYLPKSSRPKAGRGEFYDDDRFGARKHRQSNRGDFGRAEQIVISRSRWH